MIIHTIRGAYRIVCTLEGSPMMSSYLCEREGTAGGEKFLVMGAKGRELSEKLLLDFVRQEKDRVECFTKEGTVWVVFRYYEGTEWVRKIKGSMTFKERQELGKELMARLFAAELPRYLQYEASDARNIVYDQTGELRVNCLMFEPEKVSEQLFAAVQKRVADRLEELFPEELRGEGETEPRIFFKKLRSAAFEGEAELYAAYRRMDEAMDAVQPDGAQKKEGYPARLWQGIAKHLNTVLQFLYWMLIGGLLGLLVYVCIMPEHAPEERLRFERIGTLELTEAADTEL